MQAGQEIMDTVLQVAHGGNSTVRVHMRLVVPHDYACPAAGEPGAW